MKGAAATVGVADGVGDGDGVAVGLGVGEGVADGRAVGLAVGVADGLDDGLGDDDGDVDGLADGVTDGLAVGTGVLDGTAVGTPVATAVPPLPLQPPRSAARTTAETTPRTKPRRAFGLSASTTTSRRSLNFDICNSGTEAFRVLGPPPTACCPRTARWPENQDLWCIIGSAPHEIACVPAVLKTATTYGPGFIVVGVKRVLERPPMTGVSRYSGVGPSVAHVAR